MGVGSWRESISGRALSSRAADLDSIPDNPWGSPEPLNRELEVVREMEPSGTCLAHGPTTSILAPGGPLAAPSWGHSCISPAPRGGLGMGDQPHQR